MIVNNWNAARIPSLVHYACNKGLEGQCFQSANIHITAIAKIARYLNGKNFKNHKL